MVTTGSLQTAASPAASLLLGSQGGHSWPSDSTPTACSPPTRSPPRLSLDTHLLPPRLPDQWRWGGPRPTLVAPARPSRGRAGRSCLPAWPHLPHSTGQPGGRVETRSWVNGGW